MPVATGAAVPDTILAELGDLVRRAEEQGDSALPEVRAFLDAHPDLCRRVNDLAQHARLAVVELAVGTNAALKECIMRRVEGLEAELAGPDAPPLERLLASSVATSWLAATEAELTAARAKGAPVPHVEFLDRRRDRARKRLEGSVKTMALVKKLLRPALSPIQIATRQAKDPCVGTRKMGRQESPVAAGAGVEN
jgi:hypothetical protein